MEYFGNQPTLSSIEAGINEQAAKFNSLILNPSAAQASEGTTDEQLERITKILQFALGLLTGLMEQDKNPSGAYTAGKKVGAVTANGVTKLGGGASIGGAIAGLVTKHTWLLWTGLGLGAAFIVADLAIVGCALYQAQQDGSAAPTTESKEIARVYSEAKSTAKCIEKFIHCQQGSLNPALYTFEASKSLKNYCHFPLEHQKSDVYNRMISLLIQNLPQDHQVITRVKELNEASQLLPEPHISPSVIFAKSPAAFEMSESDPEQQKVSDITPQELYQKRFNQCCKAIIQSFNLNPKMSLKFIEFPDNEMQLRYTARGLE